MSAKKIRVLISGVCGRMGGEVVRAVTAQDDMEVVGGVDIRCGGKDVGEIAGIETLGVHIESDLRVALRSGKPDVVVDFTSAEGFGERASEILKFGCHLVAGTTGVSPEVVKKLAAIAKRKKRGFVLAPNFALGAVLMMKFAQQAVQYMPDMEIVELHHDRKVDAPSGTALRTAELAAEIKKKFSPRKDPTRVHKLNGCRGGTLGGISIHSIRLPGFLAHQEVIFGGAGQTLTIRHDTTSREAFMPGVILAIRRVVTLQGLVLGLENLI
ncbi:MAG: 4-hydroxy-tetrahydrodipicolinate reductase [bacterium]